MRLPGLFPLTVAMSASSLRASRTPALSRARPREVWSAREVKGAMRYSDCGP